MEDKLYPVFNLHYVARLINKKFTPVAVEYNMTDRRYYVFKFQATPEFIIAFREVEADYKKNKYQVL